MYVPSTALRYEKASEIYPYTDGNICMEKLSYIYEINTFIWAIPYIHRWGKCLGSTNSIKESNSLTVPVINIHENTCKTGSFSYYCTVGYDTTCTAQTINVLYI
jgi:hypothetical protein